MGAEQSKSNYTGGPAVRLGSGPDATGRPRGPNSVAIDPQSDPRTAAAKAAEMRRKAQMKGSSGGVPKRTAVAASSPMPTSTSGTSLEESMKNINLIDLDEAQPNAAPSSGLAPSTLVQEGNITPNLVESSEASISRPPAMEGQQDSDVNHTKPKEEVNSRLQSLFQTPQANGTTKHTPVAQEPLPARSAGARDGNANPAELRANREWIAKLNAAPPKPLPKPLKKRSGEVLVWD